MFTYAQENHLPVRCLISLMSGKIDCDTHSKIAFFTITFLTITFPTCVIKFKILASLQDRIRSLHSLGSSCECNCKLPKCNTVFLQLRLYFEEILQERIDRMPALTQSQKGLKARHYSVLERASSSKLTSNHPFGYEIVTCMRT